MHIHNFQYPSVRRKHKQLICVSIQTCTSDRFLNAFCWMCQRLLRLQMSKPNLECFLQALFLFCCPCSSSPSKSQGILSRILSPPPTVFSSSPSPIDLISDISWIWPLSPSQPPWPQQSYLYFLLVSQQWLPYWPTWTNSRSSPTSFSTQ